MGARRALAAALLAAVVLGVVDIIAGSPTASPTPAPSYSLCNSSIECGVGSFINTSREDWWCEPCPAGRHSSFPRARYCEACPAGYFAPDGASKCTPCPAGAVSVAEAKNCSLCPPGWFSEAGATACSPCPEGTHSAEHGASACASCNTGAGLFSGVRARRCDQCLPGYVYNNATSECLACASEGVECERAGVTLDRLMLKSGWWRPSSRSTTVYACPEAKNCLGGGGGANESSSADGSTSAGARGRHNYCAPGYTGPLCTVCDLGYFSDAMSGCVACSRASW